MKNEQEARGGRKGSLTDQLWRAARGARKALERADALRRENRNPAAGLLASEVELRRYVRELAGIVDLADQPEPATYRCGHRFGDWPIRVTEPTFRVHLAKQDCPECRKGAHP